MLASESGHWYDQNGFPCYSQVTASGKNKGKKRPTTLRDARKLGLLPSVTGILKMSDKPALNRWIKNQILEAAVTLPRILGETPAAFAMRIEQLHKDEGDARMKLGTAIHDSLECGFKGQAMPLDDMIYFTNVMACLTEHCPNEVWVSEASFGSELGYGGKCDLSSDNWIVDFKTKEFTPDADPKMFVFEDHKMQNQAYGHGLGLSEFRSGNLFVSTHPDHKGLCTFIEHEPDDGRAWRMFSYLLGYWQEFKNYDSRWMIADEAS